MALLGPDEDQMKIIQQEIHETNLKTMEDNKKIIKEWLSYQPHLPQDYDERIIPVFIRGCKHNIERTKRKLVTYFTLRARIPEFFQDRNPYSSDVQTATRAMNAFPLPRLTPDGYRITVHKFTKLPVAQFEPSQIYKSLCMIGDIRLIEETPISGDVFVFDVANMSLLHIAKLINLLGLLRKILHCTQEGYPQRLKEIHLVNCPSYVDKIVNTFKMFMKEKMRNRFHIHKGIQTLYKYVPQSILPEEYGGDAKSIELLQDQWRKKMESYADWFAYQENVKTDLSYKIVKGANLTSEKLFHYGTEGAFRKLTID